MGQYKHDESLQPCYMIEKTSWAHQLLLLVSRSQNQMILILNFKCHVASAHESISACSNLQVINLLAKLT